MLQDSTGFTKPIFESLNVETDCHPKILIIKVKDALPLFPINFCSLLLEIVVFTCDFTKPFLSFFFSILPQIQSILYSYLLHISKNQIDHSKLSFFIDMTYLAYFI